MVYLECSQCSKGFPKLIYDFIGHPAMANNNRNNDALESVMCDVIKNTSKRRITTGSEKGNQQLNIKRAIELPILWLGLPNFRWSFYFILLLVAFLFRHIFMTSHMRFRWNNSFSTDYQNSIEKLDNISIIFHFCIQDSA